MFPTLLYSYTAVFSAVDCALGFLAFFFPNYYNRTDNAE